MEYPHYNDPWFKLTAAQVTGSGAGGHPALQHEARLRSLREGHPEPIKFDRPYVYRPKDLNEVRRRNGLPPAPEDVVRNDRRSHPETRAKLSEAMRRSWERRRAEKPLNPQIVTIKNREVEIVPLPDDDVEYTSGGLPIGVTVVRPHVED